MANIEKIQKFNSRLHEKVKAPEETETLEGFVNHYKQIISELAPDFKKVQDLLPEEAEKIYKSFEEVKKFLDKHAEWERRQLENDDFSPANEYNPETNSVESTNPQEVLQFNLEETLIRLRPPLNEMVDFIREYNQTSPIKNTKDLREAINSVKEKFCQDMREKAKKELNDFIDTYTNSITSEARVKIKKAIKDAISVDNSRTTYQNIPPSQIILLQDSEIDAAFKKYSKKYHQYDHLIFGEEEKKAA